MCTTCGCDSDNHHHHHHDENEEKTVKVEQDILGENNKLAMYNRGWFSAKDIFAINLVSSPGSGKTTLLESTIKQMKKDCNIAVIEGDQQTDNDSKRIEALGVKAHQINTQSGCHLDAHMVSHAIQDMNLDPDTLLFIENVGNLVCPAMFDLGENLRVVVISVTEGDDKPLKYPYMFANSDVCVINKIDLLPYVPCHIEELKQNCLQVNPNLILFEVSATSGKGIDEWCCYLRSKLSLTGETFFDKMAHKWDTLSHHDDEKIEIVLKRMNIKPNYSVLDIGTGTGVLIPFLSLAVGEKGQVVGLDASGNMLDIARKKYSSLSNVSFRLVNVEKFKIEEKFNAIIMFSMFPHLHHPVDTVVRLVNNNLKEGGTLTIAHSQSKEAINNRHKSNGEDHPHSFELPAVEELAKSFELCGLEVVGMLDNDEMYYITLKPGK